MALSSLLGKLAAGRTPSPMSSPTLSPHSSRHSSFTTQQRTPLLTAQRHACTPFTARAAPLLAAAHSGAPLLAHTCDHPTTHVDPTAVAWRLAQHRTTAAAAPASSWTPDALPPLGLAGSALPARHAFASITRVLFTAQPSTFLRNLGRRPTAHGPTSVLVTLLAILATAAAAVRTWLVQKARCCSTCRGYGVQRCRVCDGAGRIDWQAKFGHTTCCPLCFNKRVMPCPDCGGFHHKPLFQHRPAATGPIEFKDVYDNDLT